MWKPKYQKGNKIRFEPINITKKSKIYYADNS